VEENSAQRAVYLSSAGATTFAAPKYNALVGDALTKLPLRKKAYFEGEAKNRNAT
jgi:hypothetical protein